jgi:hypothetical protein
MKKLNNEYLSLAIGTSLSVYGEVNTIFVKAFLMGFIIGKYKRDITEKELDFINSIPTEHRSIENTIKELYVHPDYIKSSIWTKELVIQELEDCLDSWLDPEDNVSFYAEEIYKRKIVEIKKSINYCYDKGFDSFSIVDEIDINDAIEEIKKLIQ